MSLEKMGLINLLKEIIGLDVLHPNNKECEKYEVKHTGYGVFIKDFKDKNGNLTYSDPPTIHWIEKDEHEQEVIDSLRREGAI